MKRTFALLFCLFLAVSSCFGQNRIVFHKKNSKRTFSMPYYCMAVVKMKNGEKHVGLITASNDFQLFFRKQPVKKGNVQSQIKTQKEFDRIGNDNSLSRKEKHKRLLCLVYSDSMKLNYDSISTIRFVLSWDNKKLPRVMIGSVVFAACMFVGLTALANDPDFNPSGIRPWVSIPFFIGGTYILFEAANKNIRTEKWNLEKK